jgi:thiamine pyridinylase
MRQMLVLLAIVAAIMIFVFVGLDTARAPDEEIALMETADTQRTLNIMLYPYIPDSNNDNFAAYKQRIEEEFEALNPDIDLILEMDVSVNTYDLATLESLYTVDGLDAIEIDLMMLGYVVEQGWVSPITDYDLENILALPIKAATIENTLYAMPSRICSLYLFAYDSDITQAIDSTDLVERINAANPGGALRGLLGEFYGETSLPTYYTSFFGGIYGNAELSAAFANPTDETTIQIMGDLFNDCTFEGENWCLSDHYKSEAGAPQDFANGDSIAYIGFSESLNYMLEANSEGVPNIEPAPFGTTIDPIFYTDAFTINTASCTGQCAEDAETFAQYYASVDTQVWTNFGLDAPGSPPRYLLSANAEFYNQPMYLDDPYYSMFGQAIESGFPFPSQGFPEARDTMFPEICSALDQLLEGDPCLMPSGR